MPYIADFHIHSKYSRATSNQSDLDGISQSAIKKGINLVGTGDFTHPLWLAELEGKFEYKGKGIYTYNGVDFILTTEISLIYSKAGKVRKIHIVIVLPEIKDVKNLNRELRKYGKLDSDGRPVLGMDTEKLMKIVFDTQEDAMVIPAHIWTPWFGLFGSQSGFDRIEDCFGVFTDKITALETGLSSDPPMNWMLSSLDKFTLVSNSDAHSPPNLGREANVFSGPLNYYEIKNALEKRDKEKFLFTIEFFPEEGKYHFDGHRNCNIVMSPEETKELGNICPVCGRPLTIGVLHRVMDLADRKKGFTLADVVPYKSLVPLPEIIAEVDGKGKSSKLVINEYEKLLSIFGSEFHILLEAPLDEIKKYMNDRVVEGINNVRNGNVIVKPGYDGVYGIVSVLEKKEEKKVQQGRLF